MGYGQGLTMFVLVATASMLVVSSTAKTIDVGGSEGWHFGFNYSVWALSNGPFYVNDTLVFKYDPPNSTTFPHNVFLLKNFWSYLKCNLSGATLVGNETVGGGEGLKFVINKFKPYYFACGEKNGLHCNEGRMKFAFIPLPFDRNETHR
ncbi:blue copper protein 1a-like [Macadamia integrifolia]|uniref:blue copper protein 1a-like n=1 Tax=Macadamia integrifolia TaxID=60698 RepID=UPI001C4F42B3|nr:blue copper protein 1a-like [Macadamia integrifolia]